MRKNYIYMLLTAIAYMFILSSCSNDSDTEYQQPEEDDQEVAQIVEKQKTQGILQSLCDIEEHEDGSVEYQPRIGKALYEITPTVYYAPAESLEEAENTYYHLLGPLNESEEQQTKDKDITQGDIHLTFEEGTASHIASIKVDCPRLKDILTEIVFIPSDKWPENDLASPFLFLSIWKQTSTGRIYVCVRKAQGCKGIMLTFDGGWGYDDFKKYDYWQGPFTLYTKTAQPDAFEALTGAMKYYPSKFATMFSNLEQHKKSETYYIMNILYRQLNKDRSATFDNSYTYDHHLWYLHNCYDVRMYKTTIYHDYTYSTWSTFYTHEKTPRTASPSHAFYFEPSFNTKKGWECLYRGVS